MNYKNTKLAYALVYRTKEFSAQRNARIFGTVSINITFWFDGPEKLPVISRSNREPRNR